MTSLAGVAKERHYPVSRKVMDVSLELDLPDTWDKYLDTLSSKQRHEVRRKLRRLQEAGRVNFRVSQNSKDILEGVDIFIRLFRESREDKARFMNAQMSAFFRLLAEAFRRVEIWW